MCDFIPDQPSDWFRWRCEKGDGRMALFPLSASWKKWRAEAAIAEGSRVPRVLLNNTDWLLPFVLVFPHRMNRTLTALVDAKVGDRASIV